MRPVRLFHFSHDGTISRFVPRPVEIPAARPPSREWLNGPLVWAIDEAHQGMYLFPRDCPRILIWPVESTTDQDRARLWAGPSKRMVAYVEKDWEPRLRDTMLYRYELPADCFESLDDAGMCVCRQAVKPLSVDPVGDLLCAHRREGVELRIVDRLDSLEPLLRTSFHVSAIRIRHSHTWSR